MKNFGLDHRQAVLDSFNLAIEALKKDIENKTEESKVNLTFRQDNSIFINVKVADDEARIKIEATVIRENNKQIAKIKELCEAPVFFAREIEKINVSRLEIQGENTIFTFTLQDISFSGFFDDAVRNAVYEIINLGYHNSIGEKPPKRVLLLNDIIMAKCNGKTYFREIPLYTIYDNYGNIILSDNKDYEDIKSAFVIKRSKHHTLKSFRELRGFAVLDFGKGFHVEAKGFDPKENMW